MRRFGDSIIFGSLCLLTLFFLSPVITAATDATAEKPSRAEGLKGRLIVGYQGWFGCPGDFAGNDQWQHWFFKNTPCIDQLRVDFVPSLHEFSREDLCDTGMRKSDGSPVFFYSAQNLRIVATHFRWMAEHGIDGAAVQRFVGLVGDSAKRQRSDRMIMNARAGAEASGRVFFITYDISGANPRTVFDDVRNDWKHLVGELKLTTSSSYLHQGGKPVLQLWGFGFKTRPGTPARVLDLIRDLREGLHGLEATTLIGGVPTRWRTLRGDSKRNEGWRRVYRSYDIISPWSVGRFADEKGIEGFIKKNVLPDQQETRRLGIGYMPVIFPGFSWFNLQSRRGFTERAILNQIPRGCGNFLWHQIHTLLNARVDMLYAAMFDEVD
ncbi:MAG: glycoside hydrolase family 71/99-like protein, partial [Syntrophobacteraceae bacterium]